MSLESDVRRLSGTRPFNMLPREALQLLAFSCERRQLKAGQTLFAAGEPADAAFFLLEGEIALSADGEERRVASGALIGETALIVDVMRGAGARASVEFDVAAHFARYVSACARRISRVRRQGARQRVGANAAFPGSTRGDSRARVQNLSPSLLPLREKVAP